MLGEFYPFCAASRRTPWIHLLTSAPYFRHHAAPALQTPCCTQDMYLENDLYFENNLYLENNFYLENHFHLENDFD